MGLAVVCGSCGADTADDGAWRCPRCGEPLELTGLRLDPESAPTEGDGVWRYASWLPPASAVSLGEPTTPIVETAWDGASVAFKLEAALPTGSFKDRGSSVMLSRLAERGVERVVIDSSGNAGASVSAYCARAGIDCRIFAPATASPAKLGQIEAYGASVVLVPGPRSAAADAAREAAGAGVVYAAHGWNPLFVVGTRTFAFELWEQLGRSAPDAVVVPVGSGTLLLGVHEGFGALREAGLVERVPRIFGVQVEACAPLARAAEAGESEPLDVVPGPSAAEGIMIAWPPRGRAILAAVRASGGGIIAVDEQAFWGALARLGRTGIYVEPTAAVAAAGVSRLLAEGALRAELRIAVGLTGSGLKAGEQIRKQHS